MLKKIFLTAGWILFVGFLISPLFVKVKPECRSQYGPCPEEITTKLTALNNKNLFKVRRETSKLLKGSYLVSDFSLQFKLPNILLINVLVRKPAYSIYNKVSGKYLLADETGTVLSVSDSSPGLPVLGKDDVQYKVGERISETDLFAMKILKGVGVMFQIQVGAMQNDTLVVDLPGAIRVIFPLREAEADILLGSLRLIYTKITSDYAGKFTQIDMRYKNPVLR